MNALSVDASLHVRFGGTTHIGTGRSEGLLDRTIRRDAAGEPYVPGSALKGALRMTAERLVGQLNEVSELAPEWRVGLRHRGSRVQGERCLAPRPEEMCQSHDPCVVCRLFGNVFVGSHLHIGNASPQSESPPGQGPPGRSDEAPSPDTSAAPRRESTDVLTRLRIDRRRKGAEAGALFTSEYARPTTSYVSSLTGKVPVTPIENDGELPAELVLLAAAVAATSQIGGEATTGHGQCQIQLKDASFLSSEESTETRGSGPPYLLGNLLDEESLRALAWHRFMG